MTTKTAPGIGMTTGTSIQSAMQSAQAGISTRIANGSRRIGVALALALAAPLAVPLAVPLAATLAATLPAPAQAQGQFAPVATVDGEVVTAYEYSQRMAFLALLRAPGDIGELAMDQLINEKIQLREAGLAGTTVEDSAVQAGMEEFAQRGGLDAEQLIALLGQAGVAGETLRDFVRAGITWREYVKARFLPQVNLSDAEIDAALAKAVPEPGQRVLLSEITLPATDPATRKASKARISRLTGLDEEAFAEAARRFSVGPSRANGGEMKWIDINALPPAAVSAVRGLTPGKTSRVIDNEDSLQIFMLRDKETVTNATPAKMVDYAALLLAGGRAVAETAAEVKSEVTTCDDFYPLARTLPPEQLIRETLPESQVPAPYGAELATLDPGEVSTRLTTSGGAQVVLMLCSRGNETPRSLTREAVAEQLKNNRVGTLAQMYLEELRANARVENLR